MDSCCLGDVEQATAECGSVLCHIFAGGPETGHTDAQFLQAHCVAAVPETVQPAHSLRHASTVTQDRRAGVAKPIIDY